MSSPKVTINHYLDCFATISPCYCSLSAGERNEEHLVIGVGELGIRDTTGVCQQAMPTAVMTVSPDWKR